ncbi:MAG: hypothetical protein IJ649_10950 [Oscillospiraceae bacterium]|nr:hypothetical protein [Oscillospiraceae bacterium]
MVQNTLSAAERELLGIYTRAAYDAYLGGNMRETEAKIGQIEALNPGDIHALFLRGAVTGRRAKPGPDMAYIREAIRLWRPLFEQLEGEALDAMKAAIEEALSTILYIPVELAARQWDSYYDERTANALADTVRTLLTMEDGFAAQADAYNGWVRERFCSNYVFLVDEIIGINKPFPVGAEPRVLAYGDALREVLRMAERIPETGESEKAVKNNAVKMLERFENMNHRNNLSGVI